ncbi:PIG-L family deacetylase [Caenimonas sedimenti]|uniref:PIG-L family deacetylase n=1 Tax=Caenimonas sedimenti TaxID=2596921 RepID=A0A562ZKK4_9BURK|nr:PIG-L deacetylase family protein [Caenimonas sedimenti]TWO68951.1 PIG-L family deacetylase [Caenimonas sedimenti]
MNGARVLVVAAHPDDEVLGCGATLAKWRSQGAEIQVAFLADGVAARGAADAGPAAQRRRAAARAASTALGLPPPWFGDFPDNRCDAVPLLEMAQAVEALVARFSPTTVLTHHHGDLNIDHQRVHQAAMTACRPQPGHTVRTLLFFEVPSSTEWQTPSPALAFVPQWHEDVGATLDRKLAALQAYAEELRPWPHPRSARAVEALARWRGAAVGCEAAEAFMLGRLVR